MSLSDSCAGAPSGSSGLDDTLGRAERAPPSSGPPLIIGGMTDLADECGPFIVYSREFTAARTPVFDRYADAVAHASWLARSTPGFSYLIFAPMAAVTKPSLGVEAAALARMERSQ